MFWLGRQAVRWCGSAPFDHCPGGGFAEAGCDGSDDGHQEDVAGGEGSQPWFDVGGDCEAGDDDGELAAGDEGCARAEAAHGADSGSACCPPACRGFRDHARGGEEERGEVEPVLRTVIPMRDN